MLITHYQLNTPCTVALVSDMHNRPWEAVYDALVPLHPEMICISGDILYGGADITMESQTNAMSFLKACASIAPTFLSIGNHDWAMTEETFSDISALGVTVLDNDWVRYGDIVIGGLTSGITLKLRFQGWDSTVPINPPELAWLEEFTAQEGYRILLCHHPEYYPRYLKDLPIDLVLSGHAHGGQWRFFGRGLFAPGQGLFPKLTSGVHDRLVISRGLANASRIPRINNPCEIVFID